MANGILREINDAYADRIHMHWRKAVTMAKMLINQIDAYAIASGFNFVVSSDAVDGGRTAPIFRELKR
jgi:hypothetical protein